MADTPLSPSAKGRVGEHIAAATLEELGWRVMLSPTDLIDLVAIKGAAILRVQVKASSLMVEPNRTPRYRFFVSRRGRQYEAEDTDVLALVSLDNRRVRFTRPVDARIVQLREEHFSPAIEAETWSQVCIDLLGGDFEREF